VEKNRQLAIDRLNAEDRLHLREEELSTRISDRDAEIAKLRGLLGGLVESCNVHLGNYPLACQEEGCGCAGSVFWGRLREAEAALVDI
jgi:hypothetical protein